MTQGHKQIEIMSPVGSFESLHAAIQGGANSVYFGVGKLNMRAKSSQNFSLDDLKSICKTCKDAGVKTYLTLNTIIYDNELDQMRQTIKVARDAGISAIIASDLSVISQARQMGVEVHLSTQTNITNIEAVKFFSQFADVVVTARELSLQQVNEIVIQIKEQNITGPSGNLVQIEIFVHGALCMAVSGKCYISLDNLNSSANRGACLQQCRRKYLVTDIEDGHQLEIDNEYIMSPKDLCTIDFLDKIVEAGVSVFKIEGRGRPPEYVKTVTKCYREASDAVIAGTYNMEMVEVWKKRLWSVYNRGFWDGYYLGRKIGEWTERYGSQATRKKQYIGIVTNYFSNIKVAEIRVETHGFCQNDSLLITGPTTGAVEFLVEEIRVNLQKTGITEKGEAASIPVQELVRRGDKVFKWVEVNDPY